MSNARFLKIKDEDVKKISGKQMLLLWLINRDWIPMKGYIKYSLSEICEELGFNPQSNTKKAFYEELIELEDFGIIEVEKNKAEVKIKYKKDEHGKTYAEQTDTYFTILNEIDVAKILDLSCKCKPDTLVKVYVYLKSFIYASNELQYCYPSIQRICRDTGISNKTVIKAIDELQDCFMLIKYNWGQYTTEQGTIKDCPNVYSFIIGEDKKEYDIQRDFTRKLTDFQGWKKVS